MHHKSNSAFTGNRTAGEAPARVRPERGAEVKYLTSADGGLLRQVVYEAIREDGPARDVVRPRPPT